MKIITLLIVLGTCVWACFEVSNLWVAIDGAVETEGVIEYFEKRVDHSSSSNKHGKIGKWVDYAVYVTFTTADKRVVTRPVQNDGTSIEDIYFSEEDLSLPGFRMEQGATVPLLYHPERGDLIWFDDFWLTWIFPLFITLVAGIFLITILGVNILFILASFPEGE